MNPYALLIIGVAVAAAIGAAFFQGKAAGRDSCEADSARDTRVAQLASDAAASAAAGAISKAGVRNVTVTQKLQREVIEREVFRECHSGPRAVELFNAGLPAAAGGSGAVAGGELPAADTARR